MTGEQINNLFKMLRSHSCQRINCSDCPLFKDKRMDSILLTTEPINFTSRPYINAQGRLVDGINELSTPRRKACGEYMVQQYFILTMQMQAWLIELRDTLTEEEILEAVL